MKRLLFLFLFVSFKSLLAQTDTLSSGVYHLKELPKIEDENRISVPIVKKGSTKFMESLRIHHSTLKAGHKLRPSHIQKTDEELIIVQDGELTTTINKETKVLGPGSVMLILPGDEQMMNNLGKTDVSYFVFIYKSKKSRVGLENGKSAMVNWNDIVFKPHDKGGRRDFCDRTTSMADRFEMHVTTLNAGLKSHEPHRHLAEEYILMIEGEASMKVDEKVFMGSKGDLFYLPSGSLHGIQNTGNKQAAYFAFQFN
jgi:(S)-ureidoglycine aminohydrolase